MFFFIFKYSWSFIKSEPLDSYLFYTYLFISNKVKTKLVVDNCFKCQKHFYMALNIHNHILRIVCDSVKQGRCVAMSNTVYLYDLRILFIWQICASQFYILIIFIFFPFFCLCEPFYFFYYAFCHLSKQNHGIFA